MRLSRVALVLCAHAAMAEDDAFTIRRYHGGPLGPEQMYFKPCLAHLPLLPDHVADGGLEFKIDMNGGGNTARFVPPGGVGVDVGSGRYDEIVAKALRVIDDDDPRVHQGDGESVRKRVSAAAAWNDVDLLTVLLQTCYVSKSTAEAVLFEVAATGGSPAIVSLLLRAGASGFEPLASGKTALHAALSGGHEPVADVLVAAAPSRAACLLETDDGQTAVDLARSNDFGGISRRIGKAIDGLADDAS